MADTQQQQQQQQYELRAELSGHLEDVRACMSCELGVVTASRDKTIKLWVADGDKTFTCTHTYVGHRDYVGALAYITEGASGDYPEPAIVSGSRDTLVMVWDAVTAQPLATLQGHSYQVTAVALLPTGEVVSASLDKFIKVWRRGKCVTTLEGHTGPVLSLAVLPSGEVLSGSGDGTIKQWVTMGGRCVRTLTAHTDTVRALAVLPGGAGFVSGSHDMTCKVWSVSGEVLAELIGHTALIYSVAATEGGLIASGSEDNTARIWTVSGQCLQVLEHAGCIWSVAFTSDADLVTGCADAVARVWTSAAARKSGELQATFTAQLSSIKQQRAAAAADNAAADEGGGGGGGAVPGLPPGLKVEPLHALQQPGATDGQTKIVKEADGGVWAYAWDATNFKWEKIGEVVPPPSGQAVGTMRKLHRGQEWDFVFDVDVQEGAPPLKLALNRDENPYIVADRFMEENMLPTEFKEQIVQFILQNTGGSTKGALPSDMPITGGFCDPFTGGGSSSRPGGAPPPRPAQQPAAPLSSLPITGGFVDPFTGGSRPPAAAQQPAATFFVFDNVPPIDKLAAKVRQFSKELGGGMDTNTLELSEQQVTGVLDSLLATASAAAQASNSSAQVSLSDEQLQLLTKLLSWPAPQLFPALDIARLLTLHPSTASALAQLVTSAPAAAAGPGALLAALQAAGSAPQEAAAQQMGLRVVANAFKHEQLRAWVAGARETLVDAFATASSSANKGVRLGWSTVLHNYCVLFKQQREAAGDEAKLQVLSALVELVSSCPVEDVECAARALGALSLLLAGDQALIQIAKDLGIQEVLRRIHDAPESRAAAARPMLESAVALVGLLK